VTCEYSLRSGDEIDGAKGKGGGRYRLQTLVHRKYVTKNGVGIVLHKSLKDRVVDIKRQGDMIILVKLLVGDLFLMLLVLTSLK
jgi:hypothetical protein